MYLWTNLWIMWITRIMETVTTIYNNIYVNCFVTANHRLPSQKINPQVRVNLGINYVIYFTGEAERRVTSW